MGTSESGACLVSGPAVNAPSAPGLAAERSGHEEQRQRLPQETEEVRLRVKEELDLCGTAGGKEGGGKTAGRDHLQDKQMQPGSPRQAAEVSLYCGCNYFEREFTWVMNMCIVYYATVQT